VSHWFTVASMRRIFWGRVASTVALLLVLAAGAPGTAGAEAGVTKPVKASVRIYLPDAFFVSQQPVTVPGRWLHVGGVVRPFVAGQFVKINAYLGRRVIRTVRLRLIRSRDGRFGHFTGGLSSPAAGTVTVFVRHDATSTMGAFVNHRSFSVLTPSAGFGSSGLFVRLVQLRLASLHFYLPLSGVYDAGTGWAIDAYHRLLHRGTSQALDGVTVSYLLNGWGAFPIRYPQDGRHAEGNLSLQLLALADGSQVHAIYPISSGKPSTPTILGRFHVYSKVPGYLPDGMYFSNFFSGGYAIHGFNPAPDFPASHGCMRVPIADATSIYGWLGIGDGVDVYY
jgi:L,D-transpeptidase catalytic domain